MTTMMDDTKKSIIRYEKMIITPELLEYLGFRDITFMIRSIPEDSRQLFCHPELDILVSFDECSTTKRKTVRRNYPARYYDLFASDTLTLNSLISHMLNATAERGYY